MSAQGRALAQCKRAREVSLRTELRHGTDARGIAELLVQVVGARAAVVTRSDAKVLDLGGTRLVDLW